MTEPGYMLFNTAIGQCAIAWGARGITGVHLPEREEGELRNQVLHRTPRAREMMPPPAVERAAAEIVALLRGDPADFSAVMLDMATVPPFHRRVYEVTRTIPRGSTATYGDVAARAGSPRSARAVGQALKRNPFSIVVPCHRVLAAGSRIGGFSGGEGISTKQCLLEIEGARSSTTPSLFPMDMSS